MDRPAYPLSVLSWDNREIESAVEVLRSGNTTMGEKVQQFESAFAAFVGAKYAVMVNSGSSANLLMVAALCTRRTNPIKRGSEIIVPAVSWPTTYYPLHQYGLRLVFVDIDRDTLNFDMDSVARAITPATRGVFAVNLLGNPNDFDELTKLIAGRDIYLLEDNCESLGAEYHGKQTGTFGIVGSFSFFFSHHMSTMEGGMVVTDDEELFHYMLSMRSHGWTRPLPQNNHVCGRKSDDAFEESFRFVLPGYNLRPTEVNGAIGLAQLDKVPSFLSARRINADYFTKCFQDNANFSIQREVGRSSWFGFSLIARDPLRQPRKGIVERLTSAGIECRPIVAGNFAKNEVVQQFDHRIEGSLSNAQLLDSHGLFVGNNHFDIRAQIDSLAATLRGV